jgi:hypothetical protein
MNDQIAREAYAIWQHRAVPVDQQQAFDLLPRNVQAAWLALAERFNGCWETFEERRELFKTISRLEQDIRIVQAQRDEPRAKVPSTASVPNS